MNNNAPLTPPATENDIQPTLPVPTDPPAQVPAASSSSAPEPPRQPPTAYRQLFPSLVELSVQGNYAEIIKVAERGDLNADCDWDETRLLVVAPLVLSYLTLDDLPPARHVLSRLPAVLAAHPLCQALLSVLAVTWDRDYAKIYTCAEGLLNSVQQPGFFDVTLATIVKGLTHNFIDAVRERIMALLSKSYSSLPLSRAQIYLGLPPDLVLAAAQRSNWSYDSSTQVLTPAVTPLLGSRQPNGHLTGSSLATFNRVADGNARLESLT